MTGPQKEASLSKEERIKKNDFAFHLLLPLRASLRLLHGSKSPSIGFSFSLSLSVLSGFWSVLIQCAQLKGASIGSVFRLLFSPFFSCFSASLTEASWYWKEWVYFPAFSLYKENKSHPCVSGPGRRIIATHSLLFMDYPEWRNKQICSPYDYAAEVFLLGPSHAASFRPAKIN